MLLIMLVFTEIVLICYHFGCNKPASLDCY